MLVKDSTGYCNELHKIVVNSMIRESEKHVELREILR